MESERLVKAIIYGSAIGIAGTCTAYIFDDKIRSESALELIATSTALSLFYAGAYLFLGYIVDRIASKDESNNH